VSIRALGRQFKAQLANRNKAYWPGTEGHPQGALFIGGGGRQPIFDAQFIEAGRRRAAGEANPEHSWDTPFLQHHFQKHPVQGELPL
jgi:hypothetical protein